MMFMFGFFFFYIGFSKKKIPPPSSNGAQNGGVKCSNVQTYRVFERLNIEQLLA